MAVATGIGRLGPNLALRSKNGNWRPSAEGQSDLSPLIQRSTARGILHTTRALFNIRGNCRRMARHPAPLTPPPRIAQRQPPLYFTAPQCSFTSRHIPSRTKVVKTSTRGCAVDRGAWRPRRVRIDVRAFRVRAVPSFSYAGRQRWNRN